MKWLAVLAVLVSLPASAPAAERFALIIGHNRGQGDEADLNFAEADAQKMHDVLRDLGGFAPHNMVLLKGVDAATAVQALADLERRVRAEDRDSILFVYYSGHADASALHLGASSLDIRKLETALTGSAATFRLLVLDSCRSGSVTRVKGARAVPAFDVAVKETLKSRGAVFLTSSSQGEDSQESERIRGSFFTHYLVSALMGAADDNDDGRIDLAEAYRYAHDRTVQASSRSLAGVQHPTFRYDLRGRGNVVLTAPGHVDPNRGVLDFPKDRGYLVLRGGREGAVVAEIGKNDQTRQLSLSPGNYFVIARGQRHLLEGNLSLAARQRVTVSDDGLERFEYARLVRKGGSDRTAVHGLEIGYRMRTAIVDSVTPCHGLALGYTADFSEFSLGARVHGCRSLFANELLTGSADELGAELRATRMWDFSWLSVGPGAALGSDLLSQSFNSLGTAAPRRTLAGHAGLLLLLSADLGGGFRVNLDVMGATYFFRLNENGMSELGARFAVVSGLGVGKQW